MTKLKESSNFQTLRNLIGNLCLIGFGMIIGILIFAFITAGDVYHYRDSVDYQNLPQVDAIVVLAGGKGRIAAAGDLWFRYWQLTQKEDPSAPPVPILYLSGVGPQTSWHDLARQLHPLVLKKIKFDHIIIEKESLNTEANARWLLRYASERHWNKVLLVTSSYHMRRAQFIFRHVLHHAQTQLRFETLSISQEPFNRENWRSEGNGIRVTMLEYLKWVYYSYFWKA